MRLAGVVAAGLLAATATAGTRPGTTMIQAGSDGPAGHRGPVAHLPAAGNREKRCDPANRF
jgi:hypothetical protein